VALSICTINLNKGDSDVCQNNGTTLSNTEDKAAKPNLHINMCLAKTAYSHFISVRSEPGESYRHELHHTAGLYHEITYKLCMEYSLYVNNYK
jgi:hypothetical protein